jgi:hypothetical protein
MSTPGVTRAIVTLAGIHRTRRLLAVAQGGAENDDPGGS